MMKLPHSLKVYNSVILCEQCSSVAVDIHHIIFKSKGGADTIDNLIALCRDCHIAAHKNKGFNEQLKFKTFRRK